MIITDKTTKAEFARYIEHWAQEIANHYFINESNSNENNNKFLTRIIANYGKSISSNAMEFQKKRGKNYK